MTFSVLNINGFENKALKKGQINFERINLKVFDYNLIPGIELKYLFDEKSLSLNINIIPIEIELLSFN